MGTYLDINGLRTFKNAQDAYNNTKFASIDSSTGIINAAHIPSYLDELIDVHGDYTYSDEPVFYKDNNGVATNEVVTAERGKIYCDISSDKTRLWRWSGTKWIEIGGALDEASITDSDILAMFPSSN